MLSPLHVQQGSELSYLRDSLPAPPSPPSPPLPPPSPPRLTSSGRPRRAYALPNRYQDLLPEPPAPAAEPPKSALRRVALIVRNYFETAVNSFGLWRKYLYRPSYDPDMFIATKDLYVNRLVPPPMNLVDPVDRPLSPYTSETTQLLMEWQHNGNSQKSDTEIHHLVQHVLLNPQFKLDELIGFNVSRENQRMDEMDKKSLFSDNFKEASVDIEVPSGDASVPSRKFAIPGLLHRKITSVIRYAFSEPLASKFHFSPYTLFHRPPNSDKQERVYCELYDSDAFIEEHDRVQRPPHPPDDPNCKREKVIAALMFWSDSTHLANFGTAKMWPLYMFFGNLSKYIRAQPNSGACHHIAYIPSLSDAVLAEIGKFHTKWNVKAQQKDVIKHLRRELMQAVWNFLLDEDFLHAYKFGIVIKCHDGIERRVYPRIFTYSADYPEK